MYVELKLINIVVKINNKVHNVKRLGFLYNRKTLYSVLIFPHTQYYIYFKKMYILGGFRIMEINHVTKIDILLFGRKITSRLQCIMIPFRVCHDCQEAKYEPINY